jgi:hypothetical protein
MNIDNNFFPMIIMIVSLCAAIVYAYNGDFRHCLYFFSSFLITASVIL